MNDKIEKLTYHTGSLKDIHKMWICHIKVGINETIKNLKNSYLKTTTECIQIPDSVFKYYPFQFEKIFNEIRKICIVGLYHTWERNIKELLIFGSTPKDKQTRIIDKFGIEKLIKIFEADPFAYDDFKQTFSYLKKYSLLNNAIKHGPGKSYKELHDNYTEFFYNDDEIDELSDEELMERCATEPVVTEEHIEELYKNLIKFWDNVPYELEIKIELLERLSKSR